MTELLKTVEIARFVQQGFLRFDELLDCEACGALLEDVRSGAHWVGMRYGMSLTNAWLEAPGLRRIFASARLRGIIESLLGPDAVYDHHFPHVSRPGDVRRDDLHQDAIHDAREFAFDIQLSIFPEDTPLEAGGTLIVPGSHLRRVHTGDISRYQNIAGQVQLVCKAGTVVVWHHNLWHSGRSNRSARERMMFKVRLQPRGRQYRCWDTSDIGDPEVGRLVAREHGWHGDDARMGAIGQIALFRYLSGELPAGDLPHYAYYSTRDPALITTSTGLPPSS